MSIKVISNWYAIQYILLCSPFKENKRKLDMCVADHSLTQNFTLSFQVDLLNLQRCVEYVHLYIYIYIHTVVMCWLRTTFHKLFRLNMNEIKIIFINYIVEETIKRNQITFPECYTLGYINICHCTHLSIVSHKMLISLKLHFYK